MYRVCLRRLASARALSVRGVQDDFHPRHRVPLHACRSSFKRRKVGFQWVATRSARSPTVPSFSSLTLFAKTVREVCRDARNRFYTRGIASRRRFGWCNCDAARASRELFIRIRETSRNSTVSEAEFVARNRTKMLYRRAGVRALFLEL